MTSVDQQNPGLEAVERRGTRRRQQSHRRGGSTGMRYTIGRDGTIQAVEVERSGPFAALVQASKRALRRTRRLPSLPGALQNPTLAVYLRFDYQR